MTPPPESPAEPVPVTLARLEGKVDAALAGHAARIEEHDRRLVAVDTRLNDHAERLRSVELGHAAASPSKTSPWQVAGVVVASLAIVATLVLTIAGWLLQRIP